MTSDLDVFEDTIVAGLPLVAVLEKPFSLTTMLQEIRRLLRAPRARRESRLNRRSENSESK
jgi:hypothetical protein